MIKQIVKNSSTAVITGVQILCFLLLPAALQAGEVTLAWDPNSEGNLAGYKLYYDGDSDTEMYQGIGANEGDSPIVVYLDDLADADSPAFALTGLEDGQYYYFALTAFDTDGMESDFSDEVGTMVGAEDAFNKAVDDSDTSDSTLEAFGSSGRQCFITGVTGEGTENLPVAVAAGLLLMAAAVLMHLGPIPIISGLFRRRRRPPIATKNSRR